MPEVQTVPVLYKYEYICTSSALVPHRGTIISRHSFSRQRSEGAEVELHVLGKLSTRQIDVSQKHPVRH